MSLIRSAQKAGRIYSRGSGYQRHHILPKSLFKSWIERDSNIVCLTLDEHIKAHELLLVIYPCKAMSDAYNYMIGASDHTRLSEGMRLKWLEDGFRKSVTDGNHKYWSDQENLKKHSELLKSIVNSPEISEKRNKKVRLARCKKVMNVETGKVFESCVEAAKWIGHSIKSSPKIGEACNGYRAYTGHLFQ